ncbi:hypothetical protein GL279_18855 [Paracoccus limosus]|uniref:Uncharacterized protein n=1 Tax=Paracoccus limosus TaxID=913252 RepID=A0A844HBC4_9RHOB|nr:hypothetical protein [Paracoccus limosus]
MFAMISSISKAERTAAAAVVFFRLVMAFLLFLPSFPGPKFPPRLPDIREAQVGGFCLLPPLCEIVI